MITPPQNLRFCEQDFITQIGPLEANFFQAILGLDINAVLLTDESALSDFSFSGGCEGIHEPGISLNQAYTLWDKWVLNRIKNEYGLELPTTRVALVTLFAQLAALANTQAHLH